MLPVVLKKKLLNYVHNRYKDPIAATLCQKHLLAINAYDKAGLRNLVLVIENDQNYNQGKFEDKAKELEQLHKELLKYI